MLTRSGKTLLPLFAVTMFAPTLVLGVIDGFGGLVLANLDPRLTLRLFCGAAARMTGRLLLVGVVYLALSAVKQLLELIPAAMPTSPVQYGGQFAVVMLGAAA